MKKLLCIILILLCILLTACGDATSIGIIGGADGPTAILVSEKIEDESIIKEYTKPMTFTFASGVGAWYNEILINPDGTFEGHYQDTDMGVQGKDYPNGTIYICDYSGEFHEIKKINNTTYTLIVRDHILKTTRNEWLENGVRFIKSDSCGLAEGDEFTLYMPGTPKDDLPEYVKNSWQLNQGNAERIQCYILVNESKECDFYSELVTEDD